MKQLYQKHYALPAWTSILNPSSLWQRQTNTTTCTCNNQRLVFQLWQVNVCQWYCISSSLKLTSKQHIDKIRTASRTYVTPWKCGPRDSTQGGYKWTFWCIHPSAYSGRVRNPKIGPIGPVGLFFCWSPPMHPVACALVSVLALGTSLVLFHSLGSFLHV
jgi:hypothetical protein